MTDHNQSTQRLLIALIVLVAALIAAVVYFGLQHQPEPELTPLEKRMKKMDEETEQLRRENERAAWVLKRQRERREEQRRR